MDSLWMLQSDDGAYQFCRFYLAAEKCLNLLYSSYDLRTTTAMCRTSFSDAVVFLQSLLCDPNPNSPANSEAARMYSENRREYNRRVREIVEQSWTAEWHLGFPMHGSFRVVHLKRKLVFSYLGNFEAWSLDRAELRYCKRELVYFTTNHRITGIVELF